MTDTANPRPVWRVVIAAILDFILIFGGGGYLIARLTGGLTENGFSLSGGPAVALFAAVIAYFVIGNRFFRGTLFKHILGVPLSR